MKKIDDEKLITANVSEELTEARKDRDTMYDEKMKVEETVDEKLA